MPTLEELKNKKEAKIQSMKESILNHLTSGDGRTTTTFQTCNASPWSGWSADEYNYMPIVASHLREEGFTVTSSVNHGVTDWLISI